MIDNKYVFKFSKNLDKRVKTSIPFLIILCVVTALVLVYSCFKESRVFPIYFNLKFPKILQEICHDSEN